VADETGKPKSGWLQVGAGVAAILAGGFGSYKVIDAQVANEIRANGQQISLLAARVDALGTKVAQVEAALTAVQSDRLHDLRTVFQKAEELRGGLDTLSRQLTDAKAGNTDTDRDLRQQLGELRSELNHALRSPLVGPRGR